jgi:arginine:ornithine antiporter/lysine permease
MTLIPYFLLAAYGLKLAWTGQDYATDERARIVDWIRAAVATLYAAGMIYAGGLKFLLLSAILYTPGTLLFLLANANARRRFSGRSKPSSLRRSRSPRACVYALIAGAISI